VLQRSRQDHVTITHFESLLNDDDAVLTGSQVQKHTPIAAAYLLVPQRDSIPQIYEEFVGINCVIDFLSSLEKLSIEAKKWFSENGKKSMIALTQEQWKEYHSTETCYMCAAPFENNNEKNRDHDHFTGLFLGVACTKCNMSRRLKNQFIPVVMHNLRGYDMHHILRYAVAQFPKWRLDIIPQTSEKFLTLKCNIPNGQQLRFLGSMQFLNCSHEKAVENLGGVLPLTQALPYPDYVKRGKGVFPYSYLNH